MDSIAILRRIISENGSCCWSKPSICVNCPLSKLKLYDDDRYVSCVEALGIDGMSEEEADAAYKKAAFDKLIELIVEE